LASPLFFERTSVNAEVLFFLLYLLMVSGTIKYYCFLCVITEKLFL
jgi:hypothetical protein